MADEVTQESTVEEMNAELEQLTGQRWVPDMAPLGDWISAEQVKAMRGPSFDSDQVRLMLWMMVAAARAAYSKGWQAGQRTEADKAGEGQGSSG